MELRTQTETAIFLATKHEKIITTCGNLNFFYTFSSFWTFGQQHYQSESIDLNPWHHSHKKQKDGLDGNTGCICWYFCLKCSSSYSYSAYGNREHPGNFQNKSVNFPFHWVSRHILVLPKLKGNERPFLEGCKKGDHIKRLSPRELGWYKKWKSFSFCEIWNNPTPPFFFIKPPYK